MHRVRFFCVKTERHGRGAVHDEVDPEDCYGSERLAARDADYRRKQEQHGEPERCAELEADELHNVGVDRPPPPDGADDRGEVVVGQHHGGGLLAHIRSGDPHGDT